MTAVEPRPPAVLPAGMPVAPVTRPAAAAAPVRVNLLPAEVLTARRAGRVRRVAVVLLGLLVVVLAGATVLVRGGIGDARSELAAAQAVNANLVAQQSRYAEVVAAQGTVAEAARRTAALTAGDVGWAALSSAVYAAVPAGLGVTGVAGVADTAAAGAPDAAPAAGAVATLTVTGTATDPTVVAAFVERLTATKGLADVAATSVGLADGGVGYGFTVAATVTAAALAPRGDLGTGR